MGRVAGPSRAMALRVLVEIESAPPRARFDGHTYRHAPGCETVVVPLFDLPRLLPDLAESHHAALRIAAERMPPHRNIREAHSPGITKWLSQVLHHGVANPLLSRPRLHIVQGGILIVQSIIDRQTARAGNCNNIEALYSEQGGRAAIMLSTRSIRWLHSPAALSARSRRQMIHGFCNSRLSMCSNREL
jgi:hypothetical protein